MSPKRTTFLLHQSEVLMGKSHFQPEPEPHSSSSWRWHLECAERRIGELRRSIIQSQAELVLAETAAQFLKREARRVKDG